MKVVLHIGTSKTGSSSIQSALDQARPALLAAGILYPSTGRRTNHRKLGRELARTGAKRRHRLLPRSGGPSRKIRAAVARHSPELLVLSWEGFRGFTADATARLLEFIRSLPGFTELLVHIYLRYPVSDFVESKFQQTLRANPDLGFWPRVDYEPLIDDWTARVGFPPVVSVFHPATLEGGDVVTDFFARHGIERHQPARRIARNPGYSAETLCLWWLYRTDAPPDAAAHLKRLRIRKLDHIAETLRALGVEEHRFALRPAIKCAIEHRSAAAYRFLEAVDPNAHAKLAPIRDALLAHERDDRSEFGSLFEIVADVDRQVCLDVYPEVAKRLSDD